MSCDVRTRKELINGKIKLRFSRLTDEDIEWLECYIEKWVEQLEDR